MQKTWLLLELDQEDEGLPFPHHELRAHCWEKSKSVERDVPGCADGQGLLKLRELSQEPKKHLPTLQVEEFEIWDALVVTVANRKTQTQLTWWTQSPILSHTNKQTKCPFPLLFYTNCLHYCFIQIASLSIKNYKTQKCYTWSCLSGLPTLASDFWLQ